MAQKSNQNRPKVQYRVELEKKIDINKSYSERRNQAIALRILSYGLFGQKRYQNLYLTCSLNCFYYALKIANHIHRRVAGLAMIIKFETAHVIEYYSEPFQDKMYGQKKYSKISIKLTKNPTEQDKKQPGYNPGLNAQVIQQPLTQVIARKERPEGQRYQRGRFQRGSRRGGFRGRFRGYRNDQRSEQRQYRQRYNNNDRPVRQYQGYRDRRQNDREERQVGRDRPRQQVDYRKFRTYKDQQVQEDNYRRGQRKTRGTNNNRTYEKRQEDRTYQRKRPQNRQERGQRGPRQRRYGNRDQSD